MIYYKFVDDSELSEEDKLDLFNDFLEFTGASLEDAYYDSELGLYVAEFDDDLITTPDSFNTGQTSRNVIKDVKELYFPDSVMQAISFYRTFWSPYEQPLYKDYVNHLNCPHQGRKQQIMFEYYHYHPQHLSLYQNKY